MIFTDRFVYVHEPKTGGTFVTSMLFRLYGLRWTRWTHMRNAVLGEVRCRNPRYGALVHNSNKHGGCNEIPLAQRGKKILATHRFQRTQSGRCTQLIFHLRGKHRAR